MTRAKRIKIGCLLLITGAFYQPTTVFLLSRLNSETFVCVHFKK